jgi:PAS domain S-box-containing protein
MVMEAVPSRVGDSESLVHMVLGLVPDAAVVVDGHGSIVAVNDNVESLFGWEPAALVGRAVEILVPERFRHNHRGQRHGFLLEPDARPMGAGLDLFGRRHDGSEFPVEVSLAPIALADERLVVAAIRDTSDRRAIEAVHAQLAAIVQSSLDAILAITVDGRISSWNAGAVRTLGYAADDVIGTHVSSLIPPDASPRFEEQLDAARRNDPAPPVDAEWLTRSGQRLPTAVSVSPMVDTAGTLTGFSLLLRDITERTRAESELRRLLEVSERQARWQEISAEIRLAVLAGEPLNQILQLVADRMLELMGASGVALVRGPGDVVVASSGLASPLRGRQVILPDTSARAEGGSPKLHVVGRDAVAAPLNDAFSGRLLTVVPVHGGGRHRAVLVCDERPSSDHFSSDEDAGVATSMAEQAALAIELDQAREDRERLLLSDERERIARDLHDHAVQSLFAVGLSLQSIAPLVENHRAVERVEEAVDSIDSTIKQIRTAIFTLSTPTIRDAGMRSELMRLVAQAARSLGFDPAVSFDGPIDTVPDDIGAQVLAVVQEGLSNIARHAHAGRASVDVALSPSQCQVLIVDDGVGFDSRGAGTDAGTDAGSGLRNLRSRAENLQGRLAVTTGSGQGTRVDWSVPIG